MPVYERAGRVVLPRPDVERVEVRKSEPVGAVEPMKELSHELRRVARVLFVPVFRRNQEVRTGNPQPPVWERLVQHDLGVCRVELAAVEDEGQIDIVKAHRAVIGATDTSEQEV